MGKLLKYKGFHGSYDICFDDGVLHGKIECINDLVTYEASTPSGLQLAFEEAVDDYLETCEMLGKEPNKPMSGSFNVRVGAELHKKLHLKAMRDKVSLNDTVKSMLLVGVEDSKEVHMHYHAPSPEAKQVTKEYQLTYASSHQTESNVFNIRRH